MVNKQRVVTKIQSVQNRKSWDRYRDTKKAMIKAIGRKNVEEIYLWALSDRMSMDQIAKQGFRKEYFNGINCCEHVTPTAVQHNIIYYCITLCGEYFKRTSEVTLQNWPTKSNNQLYDVLVDDMNNPNHYTFHDDSRVYPMFIVHLADKIQPDEVP